MKLKLIVITYGIFSFFSCGQKNKLTQQEIELLKKIDFKNELLSELKVLTQKELKQLPEYENETGDVLKYKFFNGVFTETTVENATRIVKNLKEKYRNNGYLIFQYESEDYKVCIAVIKGKDDLDIIKYRRTDGINYGIDNEDLIKKISDWNTKYGLIVIGCSRDWLHVEFDKMPTDMNAFTNEVFTFCPDTVHQGVGTIDKLKEVIIKMKGVWLWWD